MVSGAPGPLDGCKGLPDTIDTGHDPGPRVVFQGASPDIIAATRGKWWYGVSVGLRTHELQLLGIEDEPGGLGQEGPAGVGDDEPITGLRSRRPIAQDRLHPGGPGIVLEAPFTAEPDRALGVAVTDPLKGLDRGVS